MKKVKLQVFKVGYKPYVPQYQVFFDGLYHGEKTLDVWVDKLRGAALLMQDPTNDLGQVHLDKMQAVVNTIYIMQATGGTKYDVLIDLPTPPALATHSGKTLVASDGSVYIIGKYVPVTGSETAYYEMVDKYDGWESHIKAETLDGHLAAGNWKDANG